MRRLYRFESRFTEEDTERIMEEIDAHLWESAAKYAEDVDYVEFIDDDGFEASICSLSEIELDRGTSIMNSIYGEGTFSVRDVTEEIIMERHEIRCPEEKTRNLIEGLIERHLDEYLTKDEVLDKISQLGIESLNKRDYMILES